MLLREKYIVSESILLIKTLEKIIQKFYTLFDCWLWLKSVSTKNNIVLMDTCFSRFAKWLNGEYFLLKSIAANMFKYFLM